MDIKMCEAEHDQIGSVKCGGSCSFMHLFASLFTIFIQVYKIAWILHQPKNDKF